MHTMHTPGPWRAQWVERNKRTGIGDWWLSGPGAPVSLRSVRETNVTAAANARLVAAAPELLEALKAALAEIGRDDGGAVVDVLESRGRAAIAKAEGR